jgi:2-polyprenyl-6-methoxyphenol hydroxylase-like FAD-dependent oxidoreductase
MSRPFRVDIVGGGIGGMTLGAALNYEGVEFRVFEQAPELKAIGYGLTLQQNALDALQTIGLAEPVRSRGVSVDRGCIRHPSGRTLAASSFHLCAIHRATLLSMLAAHVPPSAVHLGHRVEQATDADLVVAADGLHSIFRRRLVPDEGPPRDSGYTAWRGLAPRSPEIARFLEPDTVSETWGRGTRFGIVPVDGEQIYWFAVAPIAPLGNAGAARAFLLDTFSGWHEPIGTLVRQTSADVILESRIVDRVAVTPWHAGTTVLLGDAAHPMTPNLGQGGCQAIEDAVVLARLLRACRDGLIAPGAVGSAYERRRRARVCDIVNQSFALGELARRSNPIFVVMRDLVFRMIPARVQQQRLARIVTFPGIGEVP